MRKEYEIAKLTGLKMLLQKCENGRTIHEIKNIQASILNWMWLLESRTTKFTPEEQATLKKVIENAKHMIRKERDISPK